MSDIFLSHVEEDGDLTFEIAAGLEASGYSTWYYERDSLPGPSYLMQTSTEIERSQAVVLIISSDSLGSHQVTKEVVRAHETGKPFVPVLRSISHVEFTARQPEWKEAVGSATSISVPREGVAVIIPRILQGLRGMGIEPSGEAGSRTTAPYAPVAKKRRRTIRLGGLRITPVTALVTAVLLTSLIAGGWMYAASRQEEPALTESSSTDGGTDAQPGTIGEQALESFEEEALDAATTNLNTSLGALRIASARLTTESCAPPQIPEPCRTTSGNNRFLEVQLQGSGGGDIALTQQFTTEGHASTVSWLTRRYGAMSIRYDEASGEVQMVYGVLPADSASGPVLLHWQENPPLKLTVNT